MRSRRTLAVGIWLALFAALPLLGQAPGPLPETSRASGEVKLPPGVAPDWWSQVQADIRAEEYHVTWQSGAGGNPAGYAAPNRAQGFTTRFSERGISMTPQREDGQKWEWGLELVTPMTEGARPEASFGDGSRRMGPTAAALADGNRIEFDRGWVTEWYVNSPEGLEQGFTIPAPPPESGVGGQESGVETGHSPLATRHSLFLDLRLTGTLHPKFAEDGQAVDFFEPGRNVSVLRYGSLVVTDATGRTLPARFEGLSPSTLDVGRSTPSGGLRIVVDATGAVYPITVDPLATSPAWTASGEAANNQFGYSVATAGDVNGDGYSDEVVGAYVYNGTQGKAYLYLGSASGLSATPAWTAVGEGANNNFGRSVATAGDVNGDGYSDVVVGANGNNTSTGKAYLYLGSSSGLSANPAWTAVGEAANNDFGMAVATAGDVNGDGYSDVVVGARGYSTLTGKAYLYLGSASGLSAIPAWTAVGEAASHIFGDSVATAGDVNGDGYSDMVVGAPSYGSGKGKVYLYLGSPSGLAPSAAWTAVGEALANGLGLSVSTAGDVNGDGYSDVVVGADGYSSNQGKAYLFLGSASGLSTTPAWSAVGETVNTYFGYSVASAGDVNGDGYSDVVVGAFGYSNFQGRAYLYLGGPSGLAASSGWSAAGAAGDSYATSVASAGDVNGDGYTDVIVGSSGYSGSTGKASLYLGTPAGLSLSPSWTVYGESAGALFGTSVASAGDVNGDGYADVVVGASAQDRTGKAYLYLGGPTGLATAPAWTHLGDGGTSDAFGRSVASAGDVNGDGYSDVIIGASGVASGTGKAYLYLGGPSGLSASPAWTATGESTNSYFGYPVAPAGDVNGDGYADVVIGAYFYNGYQGRAYVYLGGPSGLSASYSWRTTGEAANNYYGATVAGAGDVNGDGYSDVVVGAQGYGLAGGKAYLYLGGPSGLSATPSWTALGEKDGDRFGVFMSSAGDVNGDGYSDLLVGAFGASSGVFTGKAYVYLGSAAGLAAAASWTAVGENPNDQFGLSLAAAGDVNGDGYGDILVGAPNFAGGAGKAYLYYGGGGPGVSLAPMQKQHATGKPIVPLCASADDSALFSLLPRSPFGKGKAKIAWELQPLLTAVTGAPADTQRGTGWFTTGASAPVTGLSSGLAAGVWHWRARLLYRPSSVPWLPASRWLHIPAQAAQEGHFRVFGPAGCYPPVNSCWLYSVVKNGSAYTLNWQDPNQSNQRTGWNIRRSNNPALPKGTWPLIGTNVVDMDPVAANYQFTDASGADPGPGGIWYFQVTAYNANCPAEGPF